jgi:hypothetical protein
MTTAPEPRRLEPLNSSVAQVAADIGLPLRRGRIQIALKQLERLPAMVADEITEAVGQGSWRAYQRGYQTACETLTAEIQGTFKTPRPKKQTNAEWLRARIADPDLRARAKATLRLDDALLDAIAEGGVGLGSSSWRKLREALGR